MKGIVTRPRQNPPQDLCAASDVTPAAPPVIAAGRGESASPFLWAARIGRRHFREFGEKAFWVIGAGFIVSVLSMVSGVLIARGLGPVGRGTVSGVVVVTQVAVWTLTLGMARGNTYYLNHPSVGAERKSILLANSLVYSAGPGVLAGLTISTLAFRDLVMGRPLMLVTIASLLAVMLGGDFINNLLLAGRGYRGYGAKRIVETGMYVVFVAGLRLSDALSVGNALTSLLVASAVASALGVMMLRKMGFSPFFKPSAGVFGKVASFGMRAQLSDAPRFLTQFLPQLVVLPLLGVRQFGLYTAALSFAGLNQMISGPVSSVFLSEWAGAPTSVAIEKARSAAPRLLVILGVTAAAQVLLAGSAIRILYGPAFAASAPTAKILAVWFMMCGTNQFLQHVYLATGRPLRAAASSIGGLLVAACGISVLVGSYGAMGVAGACVVASVVELVLLASGLGLFPAQVRASA